MKKRLFLCLAAVLLMASGCNFKVQHNTFYLPQEQVESVEIQREYFYDDGTDDSYFRHKVVTAQEDIEQISEMIRTLDVRRASSSEPHPITAFSIIIIIGGEKEHHLILDEDIAFYDQVAYEYTNDQVYQTFLDLYNNLGYAEEDTEPDRF